MPLDVRLERIESLLRALADTVGVGVRAPEGSLRARMHAVENTLRSSDTFAQALREIRRVQTQRWTRLEKMGLFAFAAVTAVAAIVAAVAAVI